MKRQSGFSIIEVVLVLAVVVVVALVGYNLYNMQQARNAQTASNQQNAGTVLPANINSTADLDASAKALDATQLDSTGDTTALEKDLSQL